MSALALDLIGAQVLLPDAADLQTAEISIARGQIGTPVGRRIDLSGFVILPGIVDIHGDGFERHLAPRRGVMAEMVEGVFTTEAELAANGITTGVMAQFWSWEGGLRAPDYAARVFDAIAQARPQVATDLIGQLRFEITMLDDYAGLAEKIQTWQVPYVVFNDHLPHERLAQGRKPPRLTGQALKAGRNPEKHFEMMLALHAGSDRIPAALDQLCQTLQAQNVRLGSHDDQSAGMRAQWRSRGVSIAEFPETLEAAQGAHTAGDGVIMGAPNAVRGSSHKGNVAALELIHAGLCDALASDYHYPSLRRAALRLAPKLGWGAAWALISSGPARLLGLQDRGTLAPGNRADLVILEAHTGRVAATLAGGRVSYMTGEIAARLTASS